MKFDCPKCNKKSLSVWEKYRTSIWLWVACPNCGTRLSANPIILALFFMAYIWVLAFFTFLFLTNTEGSIMTSILFFLVWLIVDALNVTLTPLSYHKHSSS